MAVLRIDRARWGAPESSVPSYRFWSVAVGAAVLALSVVVWFALEPARSELPVVAAPASPESTAPPVVLTPNPPVLPAPVLESRDSSTASAAAPSLTLTPVSPNVSMVRSGEMARSAPALKPPAPVRQRPAKAATLQVSTPAPSVSPAIASPTPPPANPPPVRPVDVLDLFADTK